MEAYNETHGSPNPTQDLGPLGGMTALSVRRFLTLVWSLARQLTPARGGLGK